MLQSRDPDSRLHTDSAERDLAAVVGAGTALELARGKGASPTGPCGHPESLRLPIHRCAKLQGLDEQVMLKMVIRVRCR